MSVQVIGLTKLYGHQKAVDDVTFEAQKGMITGFLGPNGAGKSTTMKIATGYLSPSGGEVKVEGISVSQHPLEVKKMIGYLPEHNPLYLDMYVVEFLKFIARSYGMARHTQAVKIREIIELCGLPSEQHKKIRMLSKGYRQRVGLAKALLSDPPVLILDEPTTGLDPNQILEIRNVIKTISKDKTVILSTHIMQEVEALCDKVVLINRGKLVADKSLDELKNVSADTHRVEMVFEKDLSPSILEQLENDYQVEKSHSHTYVISSNRTGIKNELLKFTADHSLPLVSLKNTGGSLEEIFKSLTQNEKAV
ncbi:MAG: gliding motility-associated ABC transporter ATP-binding subunit GldA [Cyclobacteriaceae bacterium]|nr:gliding motility-associated ABC transporter ATP-binding subunit GldA [Cyclobacteriaceae bacterium]